MAWEGTVSIGEMMNTTACVEKPVETVSVLFVEESFDQCADYVAGVVAKGWRAKVASSAETAMAMAESDPPDVLVAGARLGGALDGFALARRVKSGASTRYVPVVVLTNLPHPQIKAAGRPGSCGIVAEPCDTASVVQALESAMTVARLLAGRRARREAAYGKERVS